MIWMCAVLVNRCASVEKNALVLITLHITFMLTKKHA